MYVMIKQFEKYAFSSRRSPQVFIALITLTTQLVHHSLPLPCLVVDTICSLAHEHTDNFPLHSQSHSICLKKSSEP